MEEEKHCAFQRLCDAKGPRQQLVHVLPRSPEARSGLMHARSQRQLEARILSALYSELLLLRLPSHPLPFVSPPSEFPPFPSLNHVPPAFRMTPGLDNSKDPRPSLTFQLVLLPTAKGPLKKRKSEPLTLQLTVPQWLPTAAPRPWDCGRLSLPPRLLCCSLFLFAPAHSGVLSVS